MLLGGWGVEGWRGGVVVDGGGTINMDRSGVEVGEKGDRFSSYSIPCGAGMSLGAQGVRCICERDDTLQ
jgi:hypothetical protein